MIQLITPVVFMFFFVTATGAQSTTACSPKDCSVENCSPEKCAELVSKGICTPQQVEAFKAACKATCKTPGETKVASALKVKSELETTSCAIVTSKQCSKKESSTCAPASSKLVNVDKLETPKIKPVTKDQ